jgi:hypothetical protein
LDSGRGLDKVWIYGALAVRNGQALTQTAPARNTAWYLALLQTLDHTCPHGVLYLITDHLSSRSSGPIRDWLSAHPRVQQTFIPVGAAWLNLIEGWWRLFRRKAFAGQSFASQSLADAHDIARHPDRDRRTQSPRQPLDLGPPTSSTPHAPALFCLSSLRNGAFYGVRLSRCCERMIH